MKKTMTRAAVCGVVFVIALMVISRIMNKGNTDMTVEMGPASFPVVHMKLDGEDVNYLYGYKNEMEGNYLRETLTPLPESRNLPIAIDKFGSDMRSLSYEVRSMDMERLVESTQVYNYVDKEDQVEATLNIKDLIAPDTEYLLIILYETQKGDTIRFYTRIIQSENFYASEEVAFARNFSLKTFDKSAAKELVTYLESNSQGDNTTFSKVTIHSSFNQITWGNLEPKRMTEPLIDIKEMNASIGTVEMRYIVALGEGEDAEYYNIKEYYRMRYGTERIFLLDFERNMDRIFNPSLERSFSNNKIMLGITDPDVQMMENSDGSVLVFVQEGVLYWYQNSQSRLARLFGFYDEDHGDIRDLHQDYGIKILTVDEAGNARFLVYGYMNRGRREGEVGVAVYYYDNVVNTIEEEVYLPYSRSHTLLEENIGLLSYVNNRNILYLMLDGTIYAVNLSDQSCTEIATGLVSGRFVVSRQNTMAAWQEDEDFYGAESIKLMNFNTRKATDIPAGEGNVIRPLGFMGEDIIYGIAHKEDVTRNSAGVAIFPMYKVCIQDKNGKVLKEKSYEQEGYYITGAQIEDNVINFSRVEKLPGGGFAAASDNQIMNSAVEEQGKNRIDVAATKDKEKLVQLALPREIDEKSVVLQTPKETLYEGGRELTIKLNEQKGPLYYVYAKDGIEGIYAEVRSAVNAAVETSGVVTGQSGEYVWAKGDRKIRTQIQEIEGEKADEERSSLAVCLDAMLKKEGVLRNSAYLLSTGETAVSVLEKNLEADVLNLSGCTLDSVLYYISRGFPVLATVGRSAAPDGADGGGETGANADGAGRSDADGGGETGANADDAGRSDAGGDGAGRNGSDGADRAGTGGDNVGQDTADNAAIVSGGKDAGEMVLIVGYDEKNVIIMDPTDGKIAKKGMNDSAAWFEANGNEFITYVRQE